MKLKDETIKFMENAISTAQLVGVATLVIEPNLLRGIDEDRTVFILQDKDVPDMEFGSIGLTRLPTLTSRIKVAENLDGFSIEAKAAESDDENDEEPFARSLTMKGKGLKVEYRCANPHQLISARQAGPKQMNDKMEFCVEFDDHAVEMLQKGQAAMKAETVSVISNDGVTFELLDVNNDVFSHQFADDAVNLTGKETTKFAYRYPVKTLLLLFKHASEGLLTVSQRGIMCINVNGLNVYVLPQV